MREKVVLRLPEIGLGTAPIGGLYRALSEDDAIATVERAWERGVRFFDTAPLYGYGVAEERLGQALQGKPRDTFLVSTKVGRTLKKALPDTNRELRESQFLGVPYREPIFDFSYDGVLSSVEHSLNRLDLDRIDVALIHDPDDNYHDAIHSAYPALTRLRDEGVVSAIGVGMNQTAMLVQFGEQLDLDCFLVAGRFSLLDQSASTELLPYCQRQGTQVIVGGVFNSGVLADPAQLPMFDYAPASTSVLAKVKLLQQICQDYGVSLAAAAVQFPARHPAVTSVLVGCASSLEVDRNLDAFGAIIPDDFWRAIAETELVDPALAL